MIGSVLVLTATSGVGFLYGVEQQEYLEKLLDIRRIVYQIKGELEYRKAPLGEVFGRVSVRMKEPYRSWLMQLEYQVENREEDDFYTIWVRAIEQSLGELHFKKEHVNQLKEMGSCLGQMDDASEAKNLQLYVERLELEIEKIRSGLGEKRRIGNCLGIMGGIFLIIVLI